MPKKLTLAACILWLAGLAAFIIGLNVPGDTGKWLATIGQIVFLVGLGIEGVLYLRSRKTEVKEDAPETKKPGE